MIRTTFNTCRPVSFNVSLLYGILSQLKDVNSPVFFGIQKYLKEHNVYDFRISANSDNSKGEFLTGMDTDYQYVLFNSIDFKSIFKTKTEDIALLHKINVYNRLVYEFRLIYEEGSSRCIVDTPKEYLEKSIEYIPKMIKLCAKLHECSHPYNTNTEGVFKFWMTVDNIILNALNHVELNNLKSFKANTQSVN